MTYKCSVPGCRSNYKNTKKFSVFSFPRNETLHRKWVEAMPNGNFKKHKHSRVCELHFEASDIIREASAFDTRTGRTLTAPLFVPRLRKGAVPTLFMPPSKTVAKSKQHPNKTSARKKKTRSKPETKKTNGSELAKLLQNNTVAEPKNTPERPVAIKPEPVEHVYEPNPVVIGNIFGAEDLPSSRIPPPMHPLPFHEYITYIPNRPDLTHAAEAMATVRPNKRRRTDHARPEASNSSYHQTKRRGRPRLSFPSNNLHPPAGTSTKSTGCSATLAEDATREILHTLVSASENNPFSCPRTGERSGDLFNVFGDFVADKLRGMNFDRCALALRSILDIVFKAGHAQTDVEEDGDSSGAGAAPSHQE